MGVQTSDPKVDLARALRAYAFRTGDNGPGEEVYVVDTQLVRIEANCRWPQLWVHQAGDKDPFFVVGFWGEVQVWDPVKFETLRGHLEALA